ncbi:Uncharacterised protein [Kingella negevensis]|uniref:Uncharacterized protein n=1 Tax=Kingella negevensis TaxID=1522312 RepID=A0A238HF97_9NEIS|nr:Uncharacterised protein [Kingella negevensis]
MAFDGDLIRENKLEIIAPSPLQNGETGRQGQHKTPAGTGVLCCTCQVINTLQEQRRRFFIAL